MKLPKIILAVIALHILVPVTLLVQPGCQSKQPERAATEPEIVEPGMRAQTQPSSRSDGGLDPAFNAGMAGTSRAPQAQSGGRYEPTRPSWDTIDSVSDFSASSEPISAMADEPSQEVLQPLTSMPTDETAATYVVRRGDSLWSIAKKHGISLSTLLSANGLSKNAVIHPGDSLNVPGVSALAASSAPSQSSVSSSAAERSFSGESSTYIVLAGDTLSKIARRFNTDVKTLMAVNNIQDAAKLRAGQELTVPGSGTQVVRVKPRESQAATRPSASGNALTYIVRRGDTLGRIARQFDVSVKSLMDLNGIGDPRELRAGQELLIKAGVQKPALKRDPQAQDIIPEVQTENSQESLNVFDAYEDIPVVPVEN